MDAKKQAKREYDHAYHEANKEKRKIQRKKWHEENRPAGQGRHLHYYLPFAYGITLEEFNAMVESQGGRCAICSMTPDGKTSQSTRLHVDHDKDTGRIRGLLCGNCNRAIGIMHHDPGRLRKAADYLG